ncbi:MAG: hybrid sensor histidine kinase/response regulator [Rubrivivax sp.]|nr:MAG: hybrid sensor histidine kinase/response regulator [Rubrivivax sp.]
MAGINTGVGTDLGERLTALSREVATSAGDKGLCFFFDYQGPSFDVAGLEPSLKAVVTPLLNNAIDGLVTGCVFFSVDVDVSLPERAAVRLQVVETGTPVSEPVLQRLVKSISPHWPAGGFNAPLRPNEEAVRMACQSLDGDLFAGQIDGAGRVVRADLRLPCNGSCDDITTAVSQGQTAWLLGQPPIIFESIVRRLQRLGWQVRLMSSVQAAKACLSEPECEVPDLIVGAERYNLAIQELVALADEMPDTTQVFATLLSSSAWQPDEAGFVGRVRVFESPFSPRDLHQMTTQALARAPTATQPEASAQSALDALPRALLVEDNPVNQLLSTEILRMFGFEVDVACNGLEAVDYCQRALPALIIMDLNMPVMDGLQAAACIRDLERKGRVPHIPILAVTAQKSTPEIRQRVKEAGMNGYVEKPLSIPVLQREIQRVLATTHRLQPAALAS